MDQYQIKIELLSEAIFGSGEPVPGNIDIEILYDTWGLPYLKAKTLKGLIREQMEQLQYACAHICGIKGKKIEEIIQTLLGKPYKEEGQEKTIRGLLNFSDVTIHEDVRMVVRDSIQEKKVSVQEILESLTSERYFIEINEEGITKDHSLRKARVIEKGLRLYGSVYVEIALTQEQESFLAVAIRGLRHAGTMRSKGKGYLLCSLWKQGKDITLVAAEEFLGGME